MKHRVWLLLIASLLATFIGAAAQRSKQAEPPPPWAYGFAGPAGSPAAAPAAPPAATAPAAAAPAAAPNADDGVQRHLPGSTLSFTVTQVRDGFGPADWYPGDHPQMPEIVAHGRKPEIRACSLCHYPNGKGRPENAGVAGLPYAYFIQTMADFKAGNRRSADSRKANTIAMASFAKSMTDEEIKAAAEYFGSMKWTPWIRVVETATVPQTRIAGGMFLAGASGTEPIANRVIEVPENTEATEQLRDARSGFIAYAPVGSIKRGEALVVTGTGKTTQCGLCHGADLQGLGPVPGIAGRSPSYIARQLYDMKQGTRNGLWTPLMKPVVEQLGNDDIVAITAYLASRPIPAGTASSSSASASQAPVK